MVKLRKKRDIKQPLHYEENILSTLNTVVHLSYNCISFSFLLLSSTLLLIYLLLLRLQLFIQINKLNMVNYVII